MSQAYRFTMRVGHTDFELPVMSVFQCWDEETNDSVRPKRSVVIDIVLHQAHQNGGGDAANALTCQDKGNSEKPLRLSSLHSV
jgi:hypothetical protein